MRDTIFVGAVIVIVCAIPGIGSAQQLGDREMLAFFESRIRPVLVDHCYDCHSSDSDEPGGGLRLDTRQATLKGGNSGPAIVSGRPESSLLLLAMRHAEPKLAMPPADAGEKLPATVIADFERWIRSGAFDPREDDGQWVDGSVPQKGWAWQPLQVNRTPSDASGWARNDIDRFVVAKRKEHSIEPVADADRATLVRRLAFDLTGLPPSPADFREFVLVDPNRDIEELVDRYLASPAFGERFGRHWLDVVRYAESTGRDFNVAHPHAWRYRDYVIDAFNDDMPFDQFVREQIAGDLMEGSGRGETTDQDAADKARRTIATGFLAIGPKSVNEMRAHQFAIDLADEQIDTLSQAFLGQTIACARCHDHKFDPITQRDYTALAGIFLSTETLYGTPGAVNGRNASKLSPLPPDAAGKVGKAAIGRDEYVVKKDRIESLREQVRELQEEAREARRTGEPNTATQNGNLLRLTTQLGLLEAELSNYNEAGEAIAQAMAAIDKPAAPRQAFGRGPFGGRGERGGRFVGPFDLKYLVDSPQLIRGELERPGDKVPRSIPEFLDVDQKQKISANTSGRLELAEAIVADDNPLTSRVIANRIWAWTVGKGLVTTVDNFGNSGEQPSHPELLDYLADSLVHSGWSIKSVVKQIVLSRTYGLSSNPKDGTDATARQADAENRMIWRANLKPISAEAMRDTMLVASGMLDSTRPIGSLVASSGDGVIGGRRPGGLQENQVTSADGNFRSIYLPQPRLVLPDVLQLFDAADNSMVTGTRETTIVPSQSLYWLNSLRVQQLSENVARRVLGLPHKADSTPAVESNDEPRRPVFDRLTGRRNGMGPGEMIRLEMIRRRMNDGAIGRAPAEPHASADVAVTDKKIIRGRTTQMVILTLAREPYESELYAVNEYVKQRAGDGDGDLAIWTSISKSFFSSGDFRFLK